MLVLMERREPTIFTNFPAEELTISTVDLAGVALSQQFTFEDSVRMAERS